MPEIYVQVTGDDGQVSYAPLEDWSSVELPEDVVRETAAYKQVLGESIQRRQTIAEIKAERDALKSKAQTEEPDDEQPSTHKVEKNEGLKFKNEDELMSFVLSKIDERDSTQKTKQTERQNLLDKLAKDHNIVDETLLSVLAQAQDPTTVAPMLGRVTLRFDDTSSGEIVLPKASDIASKAAAKLGLSNS